MPVTKERVNEIRRRVNDTDFRSSEDWIDFQILFAYIAQLEARNEELGQSCINARDWINQLQATLGPLQ